MAEEAGSGEPDHDVRTSSVQPAATPGVARWQRSAHSSNGAGARAELHAPDLAKPGRLKWSNGSARPVAPDATAPAAARVFPAIPRLGPRGRRLALVAVLALACVVAAVLSVRMFILASADRFSAVIQPTQALSLDFPELGHLSSLSVSPGDHVRAGEILAHLDPIEVNADVLAAVEATVAVDQQALTAANQAASTTAPQFNAQAAQDQAQVYRAKAQLSADQARLAQVQVVLAQATIRSPVNGVVTNVSGAVGELVGPVGVQTTGSAQPPLLAQTPGFSLFPPASQRSATANRGTTSPLIRLAAGPTQVQAQVPESAVGHMRPGRRATVTVPALGASFAAVLLRVVPDPVQADGGVSYKVLFVLRKSSSRLLPGMSADVTLGR